MEFLEFISLKSLIWLQIPIKTGLKCENNIFFPSRIPKRCLLGKLRLDCADLIKVYL